MGRRKIEIKRIERNEARHVTFCKRRTGLFKKLSELCIHCNSEAAALVYSPGGKIHVFSHPDATFVFNRFLGGAIQAAPPVAASLGRETALRAMCDEVEEILEAEKSLRRWWEEISLEGMDTEKLQRLRHSVVELRQAVKDKMVRVEERRGERDAWMDGDLMLPSFWPDFFFFDESSLSQPMLRY